MTRIGAGAYEGAQTASIQATQARLVLCHRCDLVAAGLQSDGIARTYILRGDDGNDGAQYDESRPPESEARRYFDRFLAPELARRHYDAVLGPCENWHRDPNGTQPRLQYRAALELALCRIVQNERHIPYGWGSIPIGNLEAVDLPLFTGVLAEAAFTSAHLYLGPNRQNVGQETDNWYLYRPTRIWLPECRRLGLRFPPVLATEVGTYYPPAQTGLSMAEYARACVDIVRALEVEYAAAGAEFLGGIPFGFGTVGTMDIWRMDGQEGAIAAANPQSVSISLTGGMPHPPEPGGDTVTEAELLRLAEDIYVRAGAGWNPAGAITKHWLASWKAGRYLGEPTGPEHWSESHRWMIQEFASAVLFWDSMTGEVLEQIPL
jgi:hypothetical protein